MKIRLPLVFDVNIDEAAVRDLHIDFGAAEARHLRELDRSQGFLSDDAIKQFMAKQEAQESLWNLLEDSVTVPSQSPTRLKTMVCLSALCQLFDVTAHIASASLGRSESGGYWLVEIRLTDWRGNFLGNGFSGSIGFPPDDYHQSMAAFFGAVVDGIRECVLQAFAVHGARDEQDVK